MAHMVVQFILHFDRCYEVNKPDADPQLLVAQIFLLFFFNLFFKVFTAWKSLRTGFKVLNYINLLVVIFTLYRVLLPFNYYDKFDEKEWREEPSIEMARDIIRQELLLGRNLEEVELLLGPLEKDTYNRCEIDISQRATVGIVTLQIAFSGDVVTAVLLNCFGD
ncbi:hypothetical protein GC194_07145 [bacterium]|nr:hypothetical protein [bacterium]